jgi:hypothetical protein
MTLDGTRWNGIEDSTIATQFSSKTSKSFRRTLIIVSSEGANNSQRHCSRTHVDGDSLPKRKEEKFRKILYEVVLRSMQTNGRMEDLSELSIGKVDSASPSLTF